MRAGESSKAEAGSSGQARKRKQPDSSQGLSSASQPPLIPPALTAFYQGALASGPSLVGSALTGHVDAKFDCGYFVTINLKNHTFQGWGASNLPQSMLTTEHQALIKRLV